MAFQECCPNICSGLPYRTLLQAVHLDVTTPVAVVD